MDIFSWVLQESASALAVAKSNSVNNELIISYALISFLIKITTVIDGFFYELFIV